MDTIDFHKGEKNMSSNYDFEAWIGTLVASGLLVFVLVLLGIAILISLTFYVLRSVGLYKMAKKMGHPSPWLAWIPYANTYLMFVLPEKPLRVLAINTELKQRSTGFFIWLAITLGSGVIASIISMIPFVGALVVSILPLLETVALIFLLYPMYYDLFSLFVEDSQAKVFAIIGMLVAPVLAIFLLVASSKEPRPVVEIEGTGNYY